MKENWYEKLKEEYPNRKTDTYVSLALNDFLNEYLTEERINEHMNYCLKTFYGASYKDSKNTLEKEWKEKEGKELEKLIREHIECIDNDLINQGKAYLKGKFARKYVKNSRAKETKNRRDRNKRPANTSPEYRYMLFDKKTVDGETIYVLNKEKAEELAEALKYQFKIKKTKMTFYDLSGKKHTVRKFSGIKPFIMSGNIDLSETKGIYVNQRHHFYLSQHFYDMMNHNIEGCIEVAKKKMKGRKYFIYFVTKAGKYMKLDNIDDLNRFSGAIDWSKRVRMIAQESERLHSKRWNDENGGAWLQLSKIPTKKKIDEYRMKFKVILPIKNTFRKKLVTEIRLLEKDALSNETLEKINKKFGNQEYEFLSYDRCNWILKTDSLLKNVVKYNRDLLKNMTYDELYNLIYGILTDSMRESYKYLAEDYVDSITKKLANLLRIRLSKEKRKEYKNKKLKEMEYFDENTLKVIIKRKEIGFYKYLKNIDVWSPNAYVQYGYY